MKVPRFIRIFLWTILFVLLVLVTFIGSVWIYFHPKVQETRDVVYGHRGEKRLLFDVAKPADPNGAAVILLVSGGWKSPPHSFRPWIVTPLLRHGYTVFAVYHVSQPEVTVMEVVEEVNRAVRYIRHHAPEYGVDPQRIGVTGASAGGHLSLMLATRGGPRPVEAADPVDRESSAVQASAIFFPVTDLLNLGPSTENPGNGGPPIHFVEAFGPQSTNPAIWKVTGRDMSPIYFVRSNLPPTLIFHGDADTLVPMEQSERYKEAANKAGNNVEMVVRHKAQHGWIGMIWDLRRVADWYDKYLAKPVPGRK